MTPQEKLKEIDECPSVRSGDWAWLFARINQLEDALRQCRIYSECYEELMTTIDEALETGPKSE